VTSTCSADLWFVTRGRCLEDYVVHIPALPGGGQPGIYNCFVRMDYIELGPWGAALRSLRASRPPLASSGARAKTYSAGLEQAEQLWMASQTVGTVASPLLLFYGLTQAGRALCAAGIPDSDWRGAEQHGLKFKLTSPREGAVLDLTKVMVEPHGSGLIQQAAKVLGSPVLMEGASLTDLVSCLDSQLYFADHHYSIPQPVEVREDGIYEPIVKPRGRALVLSPVPRGWLGEREGGPEGAYGARSAIAPPAAAEVEAWLAASGLSIQAE